MNGFDKIQGMKKEEIVNHLSVECCPSIFGFKNLYSINNGCSATACNQCWTTALDNEVK